MNINISANDIISSAKKRLVIIGKHHATKSGDTLFTTSVLSSAEIQTLSEFVAEGIRMVAAELAPFIHAVSDEGISFDNTRLRPAHLNAIERAAVGYLTAYTTERTLEMTLPDIAKPYADEAQNLLVSLVRLTYSKTPPAGTIDTLDSMTGKVYLDDDVDDTEADSSGN